MSRIEQRRNLWVIPAVAAMLAVSGCSGGSAGDSGAEGAQDQDALAIGLVADFTGPSSLFGEPTKLAAELAVKEINEAGGVNGQQLRLVVGDEASDPGTGVTVAQRFIEQDGVVALFGAHNSATRDAILPVTTDANLPYFYTVVNEGAACAPNLFITGEVPSQQLGGTIPWVQETTGTSKWFLVGNDYSWPHATFAAAKEYIAEAGGTVVGEEYVPLGSTDFQAVISKIRASGADVMIPALVGSDAVAFEKQAFDAGLGNDAVQRLGVLYEDNTRAAFGADVAAGMLNAVGYDQAIDTEANREFLASYRAEFGDDAPVQTTISIQSYVIIKAWAQAANAAGSVELEPLVGSLIGAEIEAPAGTVVVEANHFMAQPIVVTENQADGTAKIVHGFEAVSATETCNP